LRPARFTDGTGATRLSFSQFAGAGVDQWDRLGVDGGEFVPYDEATPSPDGKLWICRRPDKTRRCVFGPPPGS